MTIQEFQNLPNSTESDQREITRLFLEEYNATPEFVELRTFVEENAFGFGEKVFYPFHKMIIEASPQCISFLEIGVFRGQTLALVAMIAEMTGRDVTVYGVTPLDSTDGHWESNYALDIDIIHKKFDLPSPNIIKGLSTDCSVIQYCSDVKVNILYIDGGHTAEVVTSDIIHYAPLVKKGGYMIIDDSANNIDGAYWGEFWGLESVSKVVDHLLPPKAENSEWEYIGNILHNRAWVRR